MNAIANTGAGNAVATLQNLRQGLVQVRDAIPNVRGEPYLRLLKEGMWVYGQDNTEVQDGSLWALNPLSIMHGYACWTRNEQRYRASDPKSKKKNELLGEAMVSVGRPKPLKSELPQYNDENGEEWDWDDQLSIQAKCLNGDDVGIQTLYKVTSVGGRGALQEIIDAIIAQIDKSEAVVPVVEWLAGSYNHKQWGKTYVPDIKIRQWQKLTDETPVVEEPKAAPVEPRRRAAVAQAEPEQAAEPKPEPAAARRSRRAPAAVPETGQQAGGVASQFADDVTRAVSKEELAAARAAAAVPAQAEAPVGAPVRRRRVA